MNGLTMLGNPLELWDEWMLTVACALVAFSCFLHLNDMGRPFFNRLTERALTFALGFGAAGVMVGPFCGWRSLPSIYEIAFYCGVALYAIWLTKTHWLELPLLDRRRSARRVDIPKQAERRSGVATEEDEEAAACSH